LGASETTEDSTGNRFSSGDVLFGKLRPYLAKVASPNFSGQCSGEALVLRPRPNVDTRFLKYRLLEVGTIDSINASTYGAKMPRASWDFIGNLRFSVPDRETQKAIADFLDQETARIDQLIEKKKRFHAVLKQKWEATVTQTLTSGLQPNARKKDSGISWIGEIPTHWEVLKLGHVGRCANGINISGEAFGSGFPFVSYSDVYKNSELPSAVSGLVQSTPEDRARYALKAGDVLFTRTSETIDEVGFSSVCMHDMPDAVYAGFLIRFRPSKKKLIPLFSKFLFRNEALRAFFAKEMMIVTRASLSQNLLQKMPIVLPPLPEQEMISKYLQTSESTHASVSEKTRASINRLREFRTALITGAVTGQIDVTRWGKRGETDRRLDKIEEDMAAPRTAGQVKARA
jgi:type I restriction enzyme S subunit